MNSWLDRLLVLPVTHHAKRVLSRLMSDVAQATSVQDRLLLTHLRANADSAYGQAHRFDHIRNYREFVRHVPIQSYADFAPWVERVRHGETHAMFGRGQRVHMFAMTSGTEDRPKYVPVTDRFLADLRAGWNAFGIKAVYDHPGSLLRPIVQVTSRMDEERAPCGLPCGAITGLMAATQKRLVRRYYATPPCVANIADLTARRYTIMRLAMPKQVAFIITASPATVLQLARTGEQQAERIIRDVHDGTLDAKIVVPPDVRRALRSRLAPDHAAARRLQRLQNVHGRLLPKDYWPLRFLANWTGGTMSLYLREFAEFFGEVPIRDIGLIATEGRMSIPLEDGTPAGVAAVSQLFFEFIPAEEYDLRPAEGARSNGEAATRRTHPLTVLRSHEVQVGREYFILITTSAGFYRYDMCDCVRVVGFVGEAPLIEFLHKGAHVSSLTGEKITEQQVVSAFGRAAARVGSVLTDFVLAARWGTPPAYRLYVEAKGSAPEHHWPRTLASACDEELGRLNIEYASKRSSGRLGGIEPCVLRTGTLKAVDERLATRHRRANEQFKHRYLFPRPGEDEELYPTEAALAPTEVRA